MTIGHYTPWLTSQGGIQSYVSRVIGGQLERGHKVVLFTRLAVVLSDLNSALGTLNIPASDDDDLLRRAVECRLDVLHVHTAVEAASDAGAVPALVRTMHGHEAYCPSGSRYLALPTKRPCPRGCHVLGCTWGHFVNRCGSARPWQLIQNFRRVTSERRSARRFFTVAISSFVRGQMVRSGYNPAAIRVILNPAPRPVASPPAPVPDGMARFLFLGRLVPNKGVSWLLRAVARLGPSCELEIAGHGPQEPALRSLAEQLGIAGRVHWLGWLDEVQVRARMSGARAVVVPSLWHEPAGMVTAEAAAMARPVIAARVGGIPEYADSLRHVVLVPPGDVEALAGAMRALANDVTEARRLGVIGWERVTAGVLSLEQHLDELEDAYHTTAR